MSTRAKIHSYLPNAIFLDPPEVFDDCIIGITQSAGHIKEVVVYDRSMCIEALMRSGHASLEEAEEFFEFNTAGAYVGEDTPVFLDARWAE